MGVIDWTLAYRGNATMRQAYNVQNPKKQLKDVDPLPDKLRADFAQQYGMMVDEGLQMIQKAVELRPDYADAMAYQNLLLRQKADQSDAPRAPRWRSKLTTCSIKSRKSSRKQPRQQRTSPSLALYCSISGGVPAPAGRRSFYRLVLPPGFRPARAGPPGQH